jgi:hypothetical protein
VPFKKTNGTHFSVAPTSAFARKPRRCLTERRLPVLDYLINCMASQMVVGIFRDSVLLIGALRWSLIGQKPDDRSDPSAFHIAVSKHRLRFAP